MDCVFCKIINKEIPSQIVFEDETVVAFNDSSPQAPVHILVIPKMHVESLAKLEDMGVVADIFNVMKQLALDLGIDKTGYRIVTNYGKDAGQLVPHLHFHLLGGRSMDWPPG